MAQLKTTFAGLTLNNPIIISSSGLTNSLAKIQKLEEAGAGEVVLKSVFEEQINMQAGSMQGYGSPEADDYLGAYVRSHALNEHITLIEDVKKHCKIPVIASINCYSDSRCTGTEYPFFADQQGLHTGKLRTASYRHPAPHQESSPHPGNHETGQQPDQPDCTRQPVVCQRCCCCGIVQPLLPAGHPN